MHTVRLKLETDKEQRDMLERSFHALSHIHNVLVAHVRKLLCQLEHNHEYQAMCEAYIDLLGRKKLSREEVDILIMKRPDNMEDIYDRATNGGTLTAEENEAFKAFTIEDEENPGQRVLMENGYSIEFAASDLDRMEEIARRVTERARSVAERTADSKEKASILAKAREKAMDIASRYLPR